MPFAHNVTIVRELAKFRFLAVADQSLDSASAVVLIASRTDPVVVLVNHVSRNAEAPDADNTNRGSCYYDASCA